MRPVDPSSLSHSIWQPRRLKFYPHLDKFLSSAEANALATNPAAVAKHPFMPFLAFEEKWNKFGSSGPRKGREKSRPILYAARGDSYIYEYYRHILSDKYEQKLLELGMGHIPIAYRKLKTVDGKSCSNIDFASEAFNQIILRHEGLAIAFDISKFFENIDHTYLGSVWKDLLGVNNLPPDHFAVFKAITKYSAVDKNKLYNILGILPKPSRNASKVRSSGPIECQICDLKTFREILRYDKLAGGDLLKKNLLKRGTPQGSPISDLLANAVMIEFDKKCFEFCERHGGYYRRYSDDIVFVIPRSDDLLAEVQFRVKEWLKEISPCLEISQKKTRIHEFFVRDGKKVLVSKTTHRCPFEYLGFQFDGKHALFRSSTLSSLSRRIKTTAHAIAHSISKKYKDKPVNELLKKIDVSRFLQRFFRIVDFCNKKSYTDQSFWSYARLAERRMGLLGGRLLKQIAGLKRTAVQALENRLREIRSSHSVTTPAALPPPAAAPAG